MSSIPSFVFTAILSLVTGSNACAKADVVTAATTQGLTATQRADASFELDLRIHLAPRNVDALDDAIAQGKVLTPEEYQAQHGPLPQDLTEVAAHLQAKGMNVTYLGGHALAVQASVAQAEDAFDVELHTFKNRDNHVARAPNKIATLPKSLPHVIISGLSSKPPKVNHRIYRGEKSSRIANWFGHYTQPALDAKTIRSAYNVPGSATGKGQSVAMVELDGYDPADLDTYAKTMGIRRVPTRNVLIGGNDGTIHDEGARGEVTLDIELAMALAPNLDSIVVFEADNGDHALNDIFNRLANPQPGEPLIRAISCSWGEPEIYMTSAQARAENVILKQLAAQGQSVFVAAGDSGARDDGQHIGTDDPASQPYAVAVGGTQLHVASGAYSSEKTWADGGGGISQFWVAPVWQKGLEASITRASLVRRDVPDVALNADPNTGYAVYVGGWQTVGGTSCAAPLWAAFMALANERRAALSLPPLPFFSPVIYKVAQTTPGKAGFHDIADRSTNGYFPAVQGLDAATGWGSFNGSPLLDVLGTYK